MKVVTPRVRAIRGEFAPRYSHPADRATQMVKAAIGPDDSEFPEVGTDRMRSYMLKNGTIVKVAKGGLRPGDVLWKKRHVAF